MRTTTLEWTCTIGDTVIQTDVSVHYTAPPQVHPGGVMIIAVHGVDGLPALPFPAHWGPLTQHLEIDIDPVLAVTPEQDTAPGIPPTLAPFITAVLAPTDVTSTSLTDEAITGTVTYDDGNGIETLPVSCLPDIANGWVTTIRIVTDFVTCMGQMVTVFGTDGNDTIGDSSGPDVVATFGGRDYVADQGGSDVVCMGDGIDTITYTTAGAGLFIALSASQPGAIGPEQRDLYDGIENIVGTPFNDFIIGDDGRNDISGYPGDDIIIGLGERDRLRGDYGNDFMFGGTETDVLDDDRDTNFLDCGASDFDEYRGGPYVTGCERIYFPQPPPWP
jgi:Ca2+-binding RTX toxin-like protein